MRSIKSCNHRRRVAERGRIYREAFAFHMAHVDRLATAGRLDKLTTTGYVLRSQRRWKELRT